MKFKWLTACIVLFLIVMPSFAQSGDESDGAGRYEGVPVSRAEDGGFVLGDPDAEVTVVEFSDFMCPHCQTYTEVAHQFIEEFVVTGQVNFQYRMFPLVHPEFSVMTAKIAECAGTQDLVQFWYAHDLLFEMAQDREIDANTPAVVAGELGLDEEQLLLCMDDAVQYETDQQLGRSLGVQGTPAIRARIGDSELDVIAYSGQPYDRGGAPLELLEALATGDELVSIGIPEADLRNEAMLADTSLISEQPCGAPCWRDIIPGETSWEDAVKILEEAEDVVNLQSAEDPNSDAALVAWETSDGVACCRMFTQDGETVSTIFLLVAPDMSLGDVIELHNEPEYVTGEPITESQALGTLYFPEIPMLLYVFVAGEVEGEFLETSEILGVVYLTEEEMEAIIETSSLYTWEGYMAYADLINGEFDVVPES